MIQIRPLLRSSLAAIAVLLALGVALSACRTAGPAPRGSAASAMASGDRAWAGDDDRTGPMSRLFSGLRVVPSER